MSRYRDDILEMWIGLMVAVGVVLSLIWLVAIIFVGW